MKDLISIIVPVYNIEKYIRKCIESIINQTYKNLEIILVDDGTPDNSGKICDEYAKIDKRIKVIHKQNGGVSSARNVGLENALGEYVSFIDGDDYISDRFCEKLLQKIKEENADCIACGYYRVYDNKTEKIVSSKPYVLKEIEYLEQILFVQKGLGFSHMKLWRKDSINNIRFNENLKVAEDAYFGIQASSNIKKFYMINEPLYNYRFNEKSLVISYNKNYMNNYLEAMILTKDYIEKNYKNNKSILEKLNNYISYHVLLIVVNYCFTPENGLTIKEQIEELKKVCKIKEFENSIKKSSYEGFSITRKIALFTLKHKLYFITMLIGKIRQKQFKDRMSNNGKNKAKNK